jgi:tetratricopeptide (TPR) repeat protein
VSERERLYILEKYYTFITGETDKTIETLQTWVRLYPNDFIPHNNLSFNYKLVGRYEESLKEALEAVRLSPNNLNARDNLTATFMGLGRFDEAEQAEREAKKINADSPSAHEHNFFFGFLRRDQAAMDREAEWAKGRPDEARFTGLFSLTAVYFGKLREAEQLHKRTFEMLKTQNRRENAATMLNNFAGQLVIVGKCKQAKDKAKAAIDLVRGQMTMANAALVYAFCGDQEKAQSLLDGARAAYPKNTVIASVVTPLVNAGIEKSRGNFAQAIQLLESERSYEMGITLGVSVNYARGNFYLQQRMANEAAKEFKTIIDHPGIDFFSPAHVLAHLGLGRAAAISGDTAGARKAYQDFFALWQDADADLPALVQARREYEELR